MSQRYIALSLFFLLSAVFRGGAASADLCPDSVLARQIVESSMLHSPLPLDFERSTASRQAAKTVEASKLITADTLVLAYSTANLDRARGPENDPDYAIYGRASASVEIPCENWEGYNRIAFSVFPDYPGAGVVNVNLVFNNDTKEQRDGYIAPTGAHLVNLQNGRRNDCILEIDDLQRDRVTRIDFYTDIKGPAVVTAGDSATYLIADLRVERVSDPDKTRGWQPGASTIAHSNSGYAADGTKTAIIAGSHKGKIKNFSLVDAATGAIAATFPVKYASTTTGTYGMLDFSDFTEPGTFRIVAGNLATEPFPLSDRVWDNSLWRVLNFIYCMRCGDAVDGIHGRCHTDLFSSHEGRLTPFAGGWHDAGDLSQQTLQTSEVANALIEGYLANRDTNPALAARMLEEAKWGLRFVLANRLGNGYHASSMGLLHWTDGIVGSFDDISTVRVQNKAYDNFLYAAHEAYAASAVADGPLRTGLRQAAIEDFDFALDKFRKEGFDTFTQPYEHTYSTSNSLYYATISLAAAQLYRLSGEKRYADIAIEMIEPVLACQHTEPIGKLGFRGFFYRDSSRRSLVHSIHQSREHIIPQALVAICDIAPADDISSRCRRAVELYGDYLKMLMYATAPYAMIPSGIYREDEYLDDHGFRQLHLFPPSDATERFSTQLAGGIPVGDGWTLKRFPVWFNVFNGNTAVHLDMGKSAAICARHLGDTALMDIAEGQLRWIVGENPFNQSLIYGEGSNYPSLDNFSSGEITGAIPVGIRTHGDTDEPFWPEINNACYKEVWLTSAGKWISLASELKSFSKKY